jgi:hypothetical protein
LTEEEQVKDTNMSSEDPYKPPTVHETKRSNTALVVVVLLVLAIPGLCICGGVAAWFFLAIPMERNVQFESSDQAEAIPMTDTVPSINPAPPNDTASPGDILPGGERPAK